MARAWFARWRWIVLAAGWLVPPVAVLLIAWFAPPSALRWDPPEPRVVSVQFRAAREAIERGDLSSAQTQLEALRDVNPLNPMVHALLGQVHRQAGRTPEAIAATRMALGLDARLAEAWYNLATDYVRTGQLEQALGSLREAVMAGMDVRTPGRDDPDLARLRSDARFQVYLEGAATIPMTGRSASMLFEPVTPKAGQPFTMILELMALDQPSGEPAPSVSVVFTGTPESEVFVPVGATSTFAVRPDGAKTHYRWTYRYQLTPRAAWAGQIGPWEIQVAGVVVPLEVPVLVVEPVAPGPDGGPAVSERIPAFRPGAFFNRPQRELEEASPGIRAAVVEPGGWASADVAVTVVAAPGEELEPVEMRLEGGTAPLAWYDERIVSAEGKPERLRRVFALPVQVLPQVLRGPVTVRAGGRRENIRIELPGVSPGAGDAPP